jgi:hypothetical protein
MIRIGITPVAYAAIARRAGRLSGRPFCLAYVAPVGLLIAGEREPERARLPGPEPCGGDGSASGDGECSGGDDGAPSAPEARGLPKPFRRARRSLFPAQLRIRRGRAKQRPRPQGS